MLSLKQIEQLVEVIGGSGFNDSYREVCTRWVDTDYNFAFVFPRRGPPRIRASALDPAEPNGAVAQSHRMYFSGPFKKDEGIRRCGTLSLPHWRVINTQSDPLDDFQREFYRIANIRYLVTLSARLGDTICYVGFMRRGGRMFSESEIDSIYETRKFIMPLIHRHDELLFLNEAGRILREPNEIIMNASQREENARLIASVFVNGTKLSKREAQICALSILGYSVEAAALETCLSSNTVATYRARAFEKLGVSSGTELFPIYQQCFDRLSGLTYRR